MVDISRRKRSSDYGDVRLCTLTITRLSVCAPLPAGLGSVSLAARMHSSRRTLRSNEIPLPPNGAALDTDLDLNFSLQYPHFVKRDGNRLQILLQRRKKYKNRTILGYKTIAEGIIRMDQVLQRSMDMELELCSESSGGGKGDKGAERGGVQGAGVAVARLAVHQLSSTPVDHDTKNNNTLLIADRGYSDEEEEAEFSSVEDNDEGIMTSYTSNRHNRAMAYNKRDLSYTKQRNLKQKFVALLKRFRVPEELEPGGNRNSNTLEGDREIDELFQELDSLSCGEDSGPELDTISISSTPKPSLRPFFASSRSLAHHENTHTPAENEQWRSRAGDRSIGGPDGSLLPFLDQDDNQDLQREHLNNDHQTLSGSPPKEKDEKRSRLFRSAVSSSAPGSASGRKKQQQQSLTIPTEQGVRPSNDSAQSPTNAEPRRSLLEATWRALGGEEGASPPPDCLWLVLPGGGTGARLAPHLPSPSPPLVPLNAPEVRAILQALLNKICKYYNTSARPIQVVRLVLVGTDTLVSAALRSYVELWALRPPDWGAHVRFYIIPLGINNISRYLSSVDAGYSLLFGGDGWQVLCERVADGSIGDASELTSRINRYVNGSGPTIQLPIAEAMVAYRERSCDEDSSQIFVPFVNDVRIGSAENSQHSMDLEEGGSPPAAPRPSPPATPAPTAPLLLGAAPSPAGLLGDTAPAPPAQPTWEPLELQLDYWQMVKQESWKGEEGSARRRLEGHLPLTPAPSVAPAARACLKSSFRCLHAARLTPGVDPAAAPGFHITYATKEKKQKIMRLGKKKEKDKDTDTGRSQTLDNVSRLICSAKTSHNVPLKVYIDGAEWSSVKFFQLSIQWQTHVKNFPIALLGAPLAPQELT